MKNKKPAALRRRAALAQSGLSVEQLAKRTGRRASTLRRYIGQGNVNERTAQTLSRALGCRKEIWL